MPLLFYLRWCRLCHGKEQPQKSQLCYIAKVHFSGKVHCKSEELSRASYLLGPGWRSFYHLVAIPFDWSLLVIAAEESGPLAMNFFSLEIKSIICTLNSLDTTGKRGGLEIDFYVTGEAKLDMGNTSKTSLSSTSFINIVYPKSLCMSVIKLTESKGIGKIIHETLIFPRCNGGTPSSI